MRGLRRGRNKSAPEDVQDPGPEAQDAGAVTLVETPPPDSDTDASTEPSTSRRSVDDAEGGRSTQPPIRDGSTPLRKTFSDVATAHAELDNVLPPGPAEPNPRTPPPKPKGVTIAAPTAASIETGAVSIASQPAEDVIHHPEHPDLSVADNDVTPLEEAIDSGRELADRRTGDQDEGAPIPAGSVQEASANPLPRVLAVANQKGGVGKTTTSVNLGAALAELGFRVLVIDLDPQGNATTGLGVEARNFELSMYDVLMRDASLEDCVEPTSMKNLFVAPATIALAGAEIELVPAFSRELKLKRSIESVIGEFDYILIDCPPSLGLITVNALAAADEVLVPIQCEYYALEGLSQLMRNVHLVASNLNPKLDISTIVLTMYDARTKLADQVANEVRLHFGAKVCRNVIPRTVRLSEAPSFGQPITAFDPASRGSIAYRELAKEVSGVTS